MSTSVRRNYALEEGGVTEEAVREQLSRILASPEMAHSERLKEFLAFVVAEALAGRSSRLKGVAIAQAVFGADENFDPDSNSIVRVEAGRLRRRLGEYYAGEGSGDPVRIEIPKGSYVPVFSSVPPDGPKPGARGRTAWVVIGVALVMVLAWMVRPAENTESVGEPPVSSQSSSARFESESEVLFRQAFELLMPPDDTTRLDTARTLFRRSVEIDPQFAAGLAGESISHSVAVLFIKSEDPKADLDQARDLANTAIEINSDEAAGFAALALSESLSGNLEQSLSAVRRAVAIQPRQPITTGMAALSLLVAGEPEQAASLLNESLQLTPDEARTPFLNLHGIASYLVGEHERALSDFAGNLARSGPWGPHMDVFQALAFAKSGRDLEAEASVEKLLREAPDYPVRAWLAKYIYDQDELNEAMEVLEMAGYSVR